MPCWTVTRVDSSDTVRAGVKPTITGAWAAAVDAALVLVAAEVLDRCWLVVDDHPVLLVAGRDPESRPDLPATRAAAERAAAAASGVPL